MPQVLVRLRTTSSPGRRSPARDSGSPGTASMNASSTTTSRPGRSRLRIAVGRSAARRSGWSGCRDHQVGVVGDGVRVEREVPVPVAADLGDPVPGRSSAASGSVNCGCTTTGRRHGRSRASSVNASAAPAVGSTSSGARPCRAAMRRLGAGRRGVGAELVEAVAHRPASQAGRGPGKTLTARSTSPGPASASPWWRERVIHGRARRRRTAAPAAGARPSACAGTTRAGVGDRRSRPARRRPPSAGRSPVAGVTAVRWNSCPVTRRPAAPSRVSVVAVTVR